MEMYKYNGRDGVLTLLESKSPFLSSGHILTHSPIKCVFEMNHQFFCMKYLIRRQDMSITKEFMIKGCQNIAETSNNSYNYSHIYTADQIQERFVEKKKFKAKDK